MSGVFHGFIGNETRTRMLEVLAEHPGHAYLFIGPDGVGKRRAAHAFAAKMLHVDEVTRLSTHPDFVTLDREEGSRELKIKQTREFIAHMSMTSARGGYKVALIQEAERLNEESANALLKSVEEPSKNTVYLFVTEQPNRLPATLRSRLASIEFLPVPLVVLREHFADDIAHAVRGCPGMAHRILADKEAWNARKEFAGKFINQLIKGPLGSELGEIERLAKRLQAEADPERAWREMLHELMLVAPKLLIEHPLHASRIERGLARAWNLVGSAIPPQLALEWSAVEPYTVGKRSLPDLLYPRYL